MSVETPARKLLVREVKEQALERMEAAAQTEDDYRKVVRQWNERDKLKYRRWRRWEVGRPNAPMLHWDRDDPNDEHGKMRESLDTVIPAPLGHEWWRQLLRGDFLDVIHDCPFEMHELTASPMLSGLLQTLNDNQMEVLYYRAIRRESNRRVALRRGQSERNILKVYSTLLAGLRKKMHERLSMRRGNGLPLTCAQTQFMENYRAGRLDDGRVKVKEEEPKKMGKKKAAVDSGGDG